MDDLLAQLPPALQNVYLLAAIGVAVLAALALVLRALLRAPGQDTGEAESEPPPVAAVVEGRPLTELPGVSAAHADRLAAAGVASVEGLLAAAGDADGLHRLADAVQLEDFVVRKWLNAASLLSLPGVTPALADALIRCGVRGRTALAGENADRVQHKLADLAEKSGALGDPPDRRTVAGLIEAAATDTR